MGKERGKSENEYPQSVPARGEPLAGAESGSSGAISGGPPHCSSQLVSRRQPRRQRRLPGSQPTHRAEAARQKVPIDLPRQPHQRMAKVDDLLEKRAKQVVLAIVARLAHRSPPTANLAVEGIMDRPNQESQTAIKPACTPGFL